VIIKGSSEYLDDWVDLSRDFYNEGHADYGFGFVDESSKLTYLLWVRTQICYLFIEDDKLVGCMAGSIILHPFNYDCLVFSEAMWYIKPQYRGGKGALLLLAAVTAELKARNVKFMTVGHTKVYAEKLQKFYESLGFEKLETHYIKEV